MKKILDEKCLFIFLLKYLFISILCTKILCVNKALKRLGLKNNHTYIISKEAKVFFRRNYYCSHDAVAGTVTNKERTESTRFECEEKTSLIYNRLRGIGKSEAMKD